MKRHIQINAWLDDDAGVWLATSEDIAGLCVEAETWGGMLEEVRLILPDLMPLNQQSAQGVSLTFKAEADLDQGNRVKQNHPALTLRRPTSGRLEG